MQCKNRKETNWQREWQLSEGGADELLEEHVFTYDWIYFKLGGDGVVEGSTCD